MKIIECPRDAMQGIKDFIPTQVKISYLNQLLKVGFHTLDFGSFVSPKAIPQMKDTASVLEALDTDQSTTRLLAIVANVRGAQEASIFSKISYLGYPLSVSETFQRKNTNQSIKEAFLVASKIHEICQNENMEMVCYLSMGFGNPYGDPYNEDVLSEFIEKLGNIGIKVFSLSDTIGSANTISIYRLFAALKNNFPEIELGIHLHSVPQQANAKIKAAYDAGCRRFDGALKGFGGCPMAKDELTGNIPTENIVEVIEEAHEALSIHRGEFSKALNMAQDIFSKYL